MPRCITHAALMLAALLPLLGCSHSRTHARRPATYTMHSRIEAAGSNPHCLFGIPEPIPGWNHGPTVLIERDGYALEHSPTDRIPLWVAEHLLSQHTTGPADRKDNFRPDPLLTPPDRAELSDYKYSGYDRGHMAPSADYSYDQDRMNESFYLSNMVPQVGKAFNQASWRVLEDRVRQCARDHDQAWIFTGPMFYDPLEDDPATADGLVEYWTLHNRVSIPTHVYKIVIVEDAGAYEALAFVMANENHPILSDHDYDYAPHSVSIDFIEDRTGLNFMPDLDRDDPVLADTLESQTPALWPCLQPS